MDERLKREEGRRRSRDRYRGTGSIRDRRGIA
jgi:hypothetical protein